MIIIIFSWLGWFTNQNSPLHLWIIGALRPGSDVFGICTLTWNSWAAKRRTYSNVAHSVLYVWMCSCMHVDTYVRTSSCAYACMYVYVHANTSDTCILCTHFMMRVHKATTTHPIEIVAMIKAHVRKNDSNQSFKNHIPISCSFWDQKNAQCWSIFFIKSRITYPGIKHGTEGHLFCFKVNPSSAVHFSDNHVQDLQIIFSCTS